MRFCFAAAFLFNRSNVIISEPWPKLIPEPNSDIGAKVKKWCDRLRSILIEEITFGTLLDPELGKNLVVPWLMRGRFRANVKGKTCFYCYTILMYLINIRMEFEMSSPFLS